VAVFGSPNTPRHSLTGLVVTRIEVRGTCSGPVGTPSAAIVLSWSADRLAGRMRPRYPCIHALDVRL
jgi:hypothetical protein